MRPTATSSASDPTLWSTRRGETEYGVKAFPLGGFVRICGMSPIDERDPSIDRTRWPGPATPPTT
jgi:membrane-associated protease RseP (regulator of RpoE activity)